jgi:hypothetical protein
VEGREGVWKAAKMCGTPRGCVERREGVWNAAKMCGRWTGLTLELGLGTSPTRYVQEAGRDLIRAQLSHIITTAAEQKSVIASGLSRWRPRRYA